MNMVGLGVGVALIGLFLLVNELIGHLERPSKPPSRLLHDRAFQRRLLLALLAGGATWVVTHWPVASVAAALAVLTLPNVVTGKASKERIRRLEALEQWTRRLADLLNAGRALEHALAQSAARNVGAPIADPVATLARRISTARIPTEKALRLFADEINDPVGDRIAAALILVARRRGKGASVVLARLAEMVARDVTDRREVEAARAEHRNTIRLIIMILAIFGTLAVWQRDYVAPYGTPIGQAVLAVVVGLYGLALWWLHRLTNADIGYRFLSKESR